MIKEYHVSKNLFDKDNTTVHNAYFAANGDWIVSADSRSILIAVTPNTQYTLSISEDIPIFRIYQTSVSSPTYNNQFQEIIRGTNMETYTFTTASAAKYIGFQGSASLVDEWLNSLMLNTGSTALPYESYGNTWNTKSYCKATTGSETYSNFPIVVRSQEQSIPSWNMKGNEQHTGTASPTSPIEINGTGDRTKNLWNPNQTITRGYYNDSGTLVDDLTTGHSELMSIGNSSTFTISNLWYNEEIKPNFAVYEWDSNKQWLRRTYRQYPTSEPITFTVGNNTAYISLQFKFNWDSSGVMLNSGSTALPYEPYGYKIPISANGTSLTPVYLTEQLMEINDYADSLASSGAITRNTGKLILTGNEEWSLLGRDTGRTVFSTTLTEGSTVCMCTHIEYKATYTTELNRIVIPNAKNALYISIDDTVISAVSPSVTDFKTWLSEQYAAGTPVTVYYVLATPTTEQVAVPTIPTTSSPTTIDVNTSVKPSEMSLTYDGYKICKKQKYQNNAWT